ncbi:MAG: hypothetical protein EXQ90_01780 [Rhodospirillales bacterium]|nr:hypothetical protein [Rhodospirillales bacterium]
MTDRRPGATWRSAAVAVVALLGVAACNQSVGVAPPSSSEGGDTGVAFTRFPDMPIPDKGSFDLDRTMIFGRAEAWVGRLVINTSYDPSQMFDFYNQQLPAFGWQEVTSLRSAVSVLTYVRQERAVTVQIQKRTLLGAEVIVTVSPRGSPATFPPGPSGSLGNTPPAMPSAPLPAVNRAR